ncbi:MAG: hypothetical protein JW841_09955 [Deltaproteobacteria bacterium]|nr:hypothetical protein [Deltaproteobacteria bacterium]
MVEPAIRVKIAKAFINTVRVTEPNLLKQLVYKTASDTADLKTYAIQVVENDWLPLWRQKHFNDSMLQVIGFPAFRLLWRQTMLRLVDGPTLKPLFDGAITLFGRTPQALTKIVPRIWSLALRDVGQVKLENSVSSNQACLKLENVPIAVDDGFIEGVAGCFEAFYDLCDADGKVEIASQKASTHQIVYLLNW